MCARCVRSPDGASTTTRHDRPASGAALGEISEFRQEGQRVPVNVDGKRPVRRVGVPPEHTVWHRSPDGDPVVAAPIENERVDADDAVGAAWILIADEDAFLMEFHIDPAHRGRGYGRAAMTELEGLARRGATYPCGCTRSEIADSALAIDGAPSSELADVLGKPLDDQSKEKALGNSVADFFVMRRYDKAIEELRSIAEPIAEVHAWLAVSYAQAGRIEEARRQLALFLDAAEAGAG